VKLLKEIKITDKAGIEINPDKNNKQVVVPINGKKEFVDVLQAENIIRILRTQINIIKVQRSERKTGHSKHKVNLHA
jgi:hypothetical protein